MIISFSIGFLLGLMPDARTKLGKYLLICVFAVFLISAVLPFFSLMQLTRHAEAAASPVAYPWIISVKHIPGTADDWWMVLRFLNYEVLDCGVHEIVLSSDLSFSSIVLLVFASNLLTGIVGFIVSFKFPYHPKVARYIVPIVTEIEGLEKSAISTKEIYEKILDIYINVEGIRGKWLLEKKIDKYIKQGLSWEEAIRKVATDEGYAKEFQFE